MDAYDEQKEEVRLQLLRAFEDLSHLAHHVGDNGAAQTPTVALTLLEHVLQLCHASRAALVLTALPTSVGQERKESFSYSNRYRPLALSNIEEHEMDVVLPSLSAETAWTSLSTHNSSWLIWKVPLAFSFPLPQYMKVERPEGEEIDDAPSSLHACFLFGWALPYAPAVEQSRGRLSPLTDVIGTVLVQALTHEYVHELEIRADRRALREMELLKAELLASVSHELRSPLTSIKGYASTLLRHERRINRAERHEFLVAINEASDRLAGVIDTLLEMSELETGGIQIEQAPVDLLYLVREALTIAKEKVETVGEDSSRFVTSSAPRELTFQLLEAPSDGAVERSLIIQADRGRLREVLDHLLDNAIKHTQTGGSIRLLVHLVVSAQDLKELAPFAPSSRGRLARALQRYHRMAVISIQDSGKGMPPEALERIFSPFYRIDTRLSREVNGLGLGLAICQRIIELHHGRIWAESQEGQGSTFLVCLPLDEKG